jgi:hypothetical protein
MTDGLLPSQKTLSSWWSHRRHGGKGFGKSLMIERGLPSLRPSPSGRGGTGLVTASQGKGNAEPGDTVGKMCSTLPIPLAFAVAFHDVTA